MIQVSLDDEPPPVFRGKKEVKKKGKTLPQLVFSLKNKSNGNSLRESNNKKLEDKIKNNSKDVSSPNDYSALEKTSSKENVNLTQDSIKFSVQNNTKENSDIIFIEYLKINRENGDENEENTIFYTKNTEYNFIFSQTFIKYNNKKENNYSESKEQEKKDVIYNLRPFEEDKQSEERVIEWNVMGYN